MDFSIVVPVLERTLFLFRDITSLDFRKFPADILLKIGNRTDVILKWLDEVRNFSVEGENPVERRNALLDRIESEYAYHLLELAPFIGYLLLKQSGFGEEAETAALEKLHEIDQLASDMREQQERITADMREQQGRMSAEGRAEQERIAADMRAENEQMTAEARSVLQSIQEIAAKAGVGQQSTVFGEQAKKDGCTSRNWLISAGVAAGLSVIAVWLVLFYWPLSAQTTGEIVREIGGRFAVLTLFAFALGFTFRQFTSSKHNETVNLHRENALRTFETFVSAAGDQEIKDAVLLEATRAIFAPQSSGFLRGGHEAESPSTIIEVIRRISSGSPSKP